MYGMQAPNSLMQNIARNAGETTTSIANSAIKAANSISDMAQQTTSNLGQAINSGLNSAARVTNTAMKSVNSTTSTAISALSPAVNSLLPISANTGRNVSKNMSTNQGLFNASMNSGSQWWIFPVGIFLLLLSIFLMIFLFYKEQLKIAYDNIVQFVRKLFGKASSPPNFTTSMPVTIGPETAEERVENQKASSTSIFEKVMPMGAKEVFNISSNDYTYYDAEPLCMALGAELATYDQVKQAWEKGADWCNYGWVKGQVAVYPTQKETWDKLQHGPEDEKYACGEPGVNGGSFDNPEMRFGVNCYGKKPAQSATDERILMERGNIPMTAETLKIDQQVRHFKENADTIGVLPFNNSQWESS